MRGSTDTGIYLAIVLLSAVFQPAHFTTGDPKSCQDVEIVTRDEWLARPRWRPWFMKLPVNDVIIEHTVTTPCDTKPKCIRNIQFMQEVKMDYQDWNDIGYNFLVGGDGRVYEGRGWTQKGAHSINFNTNSIGIAFIGNYMKIEPSQKMLDAALNLIECGVQKGYLTPTREIHGHRDVACTLSPGDKLYAKIRKWKNYTGGRLPLYNC